VNARSDVPRGITMHDIRQASAKPGAVESISVDIAHATA
jgi:hypothetical protein